MCRIVGFWDLNYKKDYDLEKIIALMRDTLIHGGPDDAGNHFLDIQNVLALGHMEFENLVITYNGEVYNFREIRKELEKEGYTFKSESDTEVILKEGIFNANFVESMLKSYVEDKGINHNKLWLLFFLRYGERNGAIKFIFPYQFPCRWGC
jgi:hypothetical protein